MKEKNKVRVRLGGYPGCTIDNCYEAMFRMYNDLRTVFVNHYSMDENELVVYMSFNGTEINTDMSIDDCYIAILGRTKLEQAEKERKEREEYKRKEEEFKAKIPQLIEEYKERAKSYIKEEDWGYLCEILPIRFSDMYHGMEMDAMLDIIKLYKETNDMDKCAKLFYDQGHSGWSAGLVRELVKRFHSDELGKYVYDNSLKFSDDGKS